MASSDEPQYIYCQVCEDVTTTTPNGERCLVCQCTLAECDAIVERFPVRRSRKY